MLAMLNCTWINAGDAFSHSASLFIVCLTTLLYDYFGLYSPGLRKYRIENYVEEVVIAYSKQYSDILQERLETTMNKSDRNPMFQRRFEVVTP
jgi:hypothetical protein